MTPPKLLEMALIGALRREGGEAFVSLQDVVDMTAQSGRYSIETYQTERPMGYWVRLVDREAPVDVNVTVVDDQAIAAPSSITCPSCSRTSHHPDDVKHRFCPMCGFHDQLALPAPGAA